MIAHYNLDISERVITKASGMNLQLDSRFMNTFERTVKNITQIDRWINPKLF